MSTQFPYYLVGGSESQFPKVDMTDIQQHFVAIIQSYYPNNPVIWVSLRDVQEGLSEQVQVARLKFDKPLVVSLSSLYYPNAEAEISCNRMVDTQGTTIGLAERPGSRPLRQQIANVMALAGERTIVAVDDTLFHGDTIRYLRGLGLRIDAAVEYFVSAEANEAFANEGTSIFASISLAGYIDVMPLHDFLPCLPLCGKVVGFDDGNGVIHHLGFENGISYSLPYIMPYITSAMVSRWASIPEEHVQDFSKFALTSTVQAIARIRHLGFDTIAQASKYPMRTSRPYIPGELGDEMDTLEDVLRRAFHWSMA